MKRVWDGFWWGLLIAAFAVGVMSAGASLIYSQGYARGQRDDRADLERVGGGRYIQIQLDGYEYRGWVR